MIQGGANRPAVDDGDDRRDADVFLIVAAAIAAGGLNVGAFQRTVEIPDLVQRVVSAGNLRAHVYFGLLRALLQTKLDLAVNVAAAAAQILQRLFRDFITLPNEAAVVDIFSTRRVWKQVPIIHGLGDGLGFLVDIKLLHAIYIRPAVMLLAPRNRAFDDARTDSGGIVYLPA